jgi:hypothetical protein
MMKTFLGHAVLVGLAVATASSIGCSGEPPPNGSAAERTGNVGLRLQLAPGVSINTVNWTVTNATTQFTKSGSINTQFNDTVAFQIGGLPSGDGYVIALTATSTDGTIRCAGSATFVIAASTTTHVPVTLYCSGAPVDAGSAAVAATTQVCADITSLSASATETSVGNSVSLSATASAGSIAATYAWTATAGTFSDPTSATPIFTCPNAPSVVTLTLNVSPSAVGCPTTTSESLAVTCDLLAPTFTNVYADIINLRCISCHQPGKSGVTVGGLDMSTQAAAYADLVGVPAMGTGAGTSGVTCATLGIDMSDGGTPLLRVAPNDSTGSLIVEKVSSKLAGTLAPCGSPMPLGRGAPLTQPQVDLLQAWIVAGAQND